MKYINLILIVIAFYVGYVFNFSRNTEIYSAAILEEKAYTLGHDDGYATGQIIGAYNEELKWREVVEEANKTCPEWVKSK